MRTVIPLVDPGISSKPESGSRELSTGYFFVSPGWLQWRYAELGKLDIKPSRVHPGQVLAKVLRWYEPLVIPGLLQTEKYAYAVLRSRVGDSDEAIGEMVAARMERQAILVKEKPPTVWTVLDEGTLHRPVGGKEVMCEQLDRLLESARQPSIVVQVIPASVGAHEGLRGGAFIIADFKGEPSVAYQDTAVRGQVMDSADDLGLLTDLWDTLRSVALPRAASLELIEEVAKTWT